MQDLERVKRDFYHQVADWLRVNERISLSSITFISLIIATIAVISTSYFAFTNSLLSKQNISLEEQKIQLQQQINNTFYQQDNSLTELKFKLQLATNNEKELEKKQRKNETALTKITSKISELKTAVNKLESDKLKLEQNLKLSQYQLSENKKSFDKLHLDYARLNSDYIKVNTELSELTKLKFNIEKSLLIKTLTPIWFEPSAYFNNQAVLAIYINQQSEKLALLNQDVEYVYYKISGVETSAGSEVFKPIVVNDKQRGLYFMVYNKNAKDWAGKEKFAYIKFKNQSKEHVISFY